MTSTTWLVPVQQTEDRLDAFVRRCLPHLSRREAQKAIRERLFWINDRLGGKGDRLVGGDRVTFKGADHWLAAKPIPDHKLQVAIMYEDSSLLVVDKPAGMATHGFSGRDSDTLANFLAAQRPELFNIGKSRWQPGLVHRLDRETSGLVLIAKTQFAFEQLSLQFRRREIKKKYWALVWGIAEAEGSIGYPIAHDPHDERRMRVIIDASRRAKKQKSWTALSCFRRLSVSQELSLLEIDMETGVTHQIRVHLAAIGHPIVGDLLYGPDRTENFGLQRHFLHACRLEFRHPKDRGVVKVETGLPGELQEVLKRLGMKC